MIDTHFKNKKILFFSAHPDDEIAGAGGLFIKANQNDSKIKLVLCIDPSEHRLDTSPEKERATRLSEYQKIARHLNATNSYLGLSKYPNLSWENIAPLVKEVRDFKPDIVITLSKDERHTEHKMVNELVMRAVWHAGRPAFPDLGEPHKTQTILESEADAPMQEPSFLLDITDFIEEKKKLMNGYESQVNRKDLATACEGINAFRGHMYRKGTHAEAYKIKEFYYG